MLNGCDPATATDMTGQSTVKINFGGALGLVYAPPCIKVSPGTSVSFSGDFSFHPLRGGTVVGFMVTPDAGSPIQPTNAGVSASFTLPNAGSFGYYCNFHATSGMAGAIFVQ